MDDRAKNDRSNEHFHQLDKAVTQRFERFTECRNEVPDENSEENSGKNLKIKMVVKRFTPDHGRRVAENEERTTRKSKARKMR